jgi:Holliday junction resolvase-like predicted endonuclease
MPWGAENGTDRATGSRAELEARRHLERDGYQVTDHPFGATGPDLLIEREGRSPRLVEVRCKYADHKGRYGLEAPKNVLWAAADVCYLIKDTDRRAWCVAAVRQLPKPERGAPGSYHASEFDPEIPNYYWPANCWRELPWAYEE